MAGPAATTSLGPRDGADIGSIAPRPVGPRSKRPVVVDRPVRPAPGPDGCVGFATNGCPNGPAPAGPRSIAAGHAPTGLIRPVSRPNINDSARTTREDVAVVIAATCCRSRASAGPDGFIATPDAKAGPIWPVGPPMTDDPFVRRVPTRCDNPVCRKTFDRLVNRFTGRTVAQTRRKYCSDSCRQQAQWHLKSGDDKRAKAARLRQSRRRKRLNV